MTTNFNYLLTYHGYNDEFSGYSVGILSKEHVYSFLWATQSLYNGFSCDGRVSSDEDSYYVIGNNVLCFLTLYASYK